jgi:hypothetical protein
MENRKQFTETRPNSTFILEVNSRKYNKKCGDQCEHKEQMLNRKRGNKKGIKRECINKGQIKVD